MQTTQISVTLNILQFNELDILHQQLVLEAKKQLDFAYAPYSKFHVGAAVLLQNEKILGGCNQENASYPLCMCGERVALYHSAIAEPNQKILSLAITARNPNHLLLKPVMPCGACRQVILEYEQRQRSKIKIYLRTDDEMIYVSDSAANLIPYGFDGSFLI